jgi:hypothetical protein
VCPFASGKPTYGDLSEFNKRIGDYASIENRERSGIGCNQHILYEIKDIITYKKNVCDTLPPVVGSTDAICGLFLI